MGQRSRPMPFDITVNPLYIDSGPYPSQGRGWQEKCFIENTGDPDTVGERTKARGVIPSAWEHLCVTSSGANAIAVASGAAWCRGTEFIFDEINAPVPPLNFTPASAPGGQTRVDVVVVVQNNDSGTYSTNLAFPTTLTDYNANPNVPAYCTRLAILTGIPSGGVPSARAMVQTDIQWMIPLAQYTIDDAGVITALTDLRQFAQTEFVVGVHTSDNNQPIDVLTMGVEVDNGAGADGLGAFLLARLEDDGGTLQNAGRIGLAWHTATAGAEQSSFKVYTERASSDVVSAVIVSPSAASPDGDQRGVGAVDLQGYRLLVTQVASGLRGVISGGGANTASGDDSTVGGGLFNQATGGASVIAGGTVNVASGVTSTVAGGNVNQATDDYATVGGGFNNTASAQSSTIAGGEQNIASGVSATVGGGDTNDVSTESATISGGSGNTANALYATVPGGYQGKASIYGQVAAASGRFAADGDAQGTLQMTFRRSVVHPGGASWQTLYLDGTAVVATIPSDTVWTVNVLISGTTQGGGAGMDVAGYTIDAVIENDNGAAAIKTQTVTEIHDDTATCDAQLAISGTSLVVQVEDTNAVTRRWVATLRSSEVTYG